MPPPPDPAPTGLPQTNGTTPGPQPPDGATGPQCACTPTTAPGDGAAWPERVGRYKIEGEVGRGGMGVVLRAQDPDLGRALAVKLLLAGPGERAEFERRFLEEARLTGQLQHPGVPPVHELGRLEDGRPFFAMKLVKGHTLAQLLQQRKEPGEDLPGFVAVFGQLCQAVAYAHSKGILHRDIKPGNVMVGQ